LKTESLIRPNVIQILTDTINLRGTAICQWLCG